MEGDVSAHSLRSCIAVRGELPKGAFEMMHDVVMHLIGESEHGWAYGNTQVVNWRGPYGQKKKNYCPMWLDIAETGSYMHLFCYAIMLACTMEPLSSYRTQLSLVLEPARCSWWYRFNLWIQIWLAGMSLLYYRFGKSGLVHCNISYWKHGVWKHVMYLMDLQVKCEGQREYSWINNEEEVWLDLWCNMEDKYGGY